MTSQQNAALIQLQAITSSIKLNDYLMSAALVSVRARKLLTTAISVNHYLTQVRLDLLSEEDDSAAKLVLDTTTKALVARLVQLLQDITEDDWQAEQLQEDCRAYEEAVTNYASQLWPVGLGRAHLWDKT